MESSVNFWGGDQPSIKVDPVRDGLFNYDAESQKAATSARPWSKDPNYFKKVRISAIALIKMVMHARSGGSNEVMGLMQGYVDGNSFVITDAVRLPVEGTETRVNAQDDANAYVVEYFELCREQGRMENAVGWYHSHPGYGCWLSGIDVSTQELQQSFIDPFLAVVIDPDRTVSAGKVEIGAFRTYPEKYEPQKSGSSTTDGVQSVPLEKAADFGAHAHRYYSLEIEHFKSLMDAQVLDLLWNKYWVQTLSQSPLITNKDYDGKQILDLSAKIAKVTEHLKRAGHTGGPTGNGVGAAAFGGGMAKAVDEKLQKVGQDSKTLAERGRAGLMASGMKAAIFDAGPETPGESSHH